MSGSGICTSLQTDNHTSTSPLSFLQARCPSCRPTNSVKALKAHHVNTIASKISSLLYFLKQLEQSCAEPDDLLCFYTTAVRPVAQYACPVWYSSLTAAQTKALE